MVSVAPLSLRVSHSFTSRSRICRDTDMASVGTGAAWVALLVPLPSPSTFHHPSKDQDTFWD